MMSPRHSDFKILDVMASGNPPLGGPLYRAIGEGTLDDPGLTLILYTRLSSRQTLKRRTSAYKIAWTRLGLPLNGLVKGLLPPLSRCNFYTRRTCL